MLLGFPKNKYFFIKSCSNDNVVDVSSGETSLNSTIVTWPMKSADDYDNQLWRHDNGYLINKKSELVMDVRGGDLKSDKPIVQFTRKITMAHNQRFGYRDGFIYCLADPRLVLDVKRGSKKDGSKVILYKRKATDNSNQQWKIECLEEDEQPLEDAYDNQVGIPFPHHNHVPYYPPPASHSSHSIPYYPPPNNGYGYPRSTSYDE